MRKYPQGVKMVDAVYDRGVDNPFVASLPEMMSAKQVLSELRSRISLPDNMSSLSFDDRRQYISLLSNLLIPQNHMVQIYDVLYRAIQTSYMTMNVVDGIRAMNSMYRGEMPTGASFYSGSVLGVPGVGKTSTIRSVLQKLFPQVVQHQTFNGRPFFCKNILWLHVECPINGDMKGLIFSVVQKLDEALGTSYLETMLALRSASVSAMCTRLRLLCANFRLGVLVIDEIQNLVSNEEKKRQLRPLIKFLVELTNSCTSILFVGTPTVRDLFDKEPHLARRTKGPILLPMRPDGCFQAFIEELWQYQLTPMQAELTLRIRNLLYDVTGGNPAYLKLVFTEAMADCLLLQKPMITETNIKKVVENLGIKVPKTYSKFGGTFISDYEDYPDIEEKLVMEGEVTRLYARPRGRKKVARNEKDILAAYKSGNLREFLAKNGMLEVLR